MTKLASIKEIIQDAKKGKLFILVDDHNRENEGDLIIPGSKCTSKHINFMAKHGREPECFLLTKKKIKQLNLKLMTMSNKSRFQTAFTVSIESRKGVSTGISVFDRAKTIKVAIKPKSSSRDISTPGHIFPLVSKNGGVLERAGHTEASVDISKLANLNPSAVICEVLNDDGRMARLNDLIKFGKRHKIKIASIEDLIAFRLKTENFIKLISQKIFNFSNHGKIDLKIYKNNLDGLEHYVFAKGNISGKDPVRVRVFAKANIAVNFNKKPNIKGVFKTLKYLNKYKKFVFVMINKKEKDIVENDKTNTLRQYGIGAQILKKLGVKKIILVSRSRKNIIGLKGFDIKIVKQEITNNL